MIFLNIKGNSTDTNVNLDTPICLQLFLFLLHFVLKIIAFKGRNKARSSDMTECICYLVGHKFPVYFRNIKSKNI